MVDARHDLVRVRKPGSIRARRQEAHRSGILVDNSNRLDPLVDSGGRRARDRQIEEIVNGFGLDWLGNDPGGRIGQTVQKRCLICQLS